MTRAPAASGARPIRFMAFTLVELMIAIGIFSGVMVAIYASWSAILNGSKRGMQAALDAQRMRVAHRCVTDALLSMQMFQDTTGLYAFFADTSGDFASVSLVARLPDSFPGSGVFDDQPVRRVTLTVEPSAEGSGQLVMRQQPLLSADETGDQSYTLTLAQDVSLFSMEFWAANAREWADEWTLTNQLPKLVRVTLGFGHEGGYRGGRPREVVSRTVAVAGIVIPRPYQMPRGPAGPGGAPGAPGLDPNRPGGAPGGAPGSPTTPLPRTGGGRI